MANRGEKMETVTDFIFLHSTITADCDFKRCFLLQWKAVTNVYSVLKSRDNTLLTLSPYSQSYVFSSSDVGMWELDHKEGWTLKNWCFWTVVLEKTLESPLDSKEIKSINPKGNQLWIFIIRTDVDTPIFWPSDKKCLIGKDADAGKDWGWGRSGTAEDEITSPFCCTCCSVSQSCPTIWDSWLDSIINSMDMNLSKL